MGAEPRRLRHAGEVPPPRPLHRGQQPRTQSAAAHPLRIRVSNRAGAKTRSLLPSDKGSRARAPGRQAGSPHSTRSLRMSEAYMVQRWLDWNRRGAGRERSYATRERYSYHRNILYSNNWPVARLVAAGKKWVCLTKTGAGPSTTADGAVVTIRVPCIGAYSQHIDDQIDDKALHDRIKWLLLRQGQEMIDRALLLSPSQLLVNTQHGRAEHIYMKDEIDATARLFSEYAAAFDLRWGAYPKQYVIDFKQIVDKRRDDYFSDKKTRARERVKARKDAKTALGLKEDES